MSRLSRSDTQHCFDARRPIARLRTRRSRAPPAGVNRRVKSGRCVKKYESRKYEKKSPIHENADANITCDFGDGDISCLGVANQTHVYKHRSLAVGLYQDGNHALP